MALEILILIYLIEATYLYDKPPGEGDNKGVRYTSYGREVIDKET